MTEDEAKTKWCPMTRMASTAGTLSGDNLFFSCNVDATHERTPCIASGCMMWRWDNPLKGEADAFGESGHCGLAGEP